MNLHDRTDAVDLVKAALAKDKGITILSKGDVPGHEFHGNQYAGGGEAQKATISASIASKQANASGSPEDHNSAGNAHDAAMRAHLTAQRNASLQGDRMNANAHKKEADFHRESRNAHEAKAAPMFENGKHTDSKQIAGLKAAGVAVRNAMRDAGNLKTPRE